MFGKPTRILTRSACVNRHPAGAVAKALLDWAARRDEQQPLTPNEPRAEISISVEGAPAALLTLTLADAEELRRRLLGEGR